MTTPSLYNLDSLKSIAQGDVSFIQKMIGLFLQQVDDFCQKAPVSLKEKQYEELSGQAHKLKSSLKTLRVESVLEDVLKIELDAKNGERLEELPALLDSVLEKLATIQATLREDFPTI